MAKLKRRKSKLFSSSYKKSKGRVYTGFPDSVVNAGIAILSLLLLAFIFSFSSRQTRGGVPIEVHFPVSSNNKILAADIYNSNPILDIDVEILNGCGEPGLATKFSNFLRNEKIDVVRSDNADHFDYNRTILIQRNENVKAVKLVADALGFDIKNSSRVKIETDSNLDVDLTLIIGKDYNSIKSFTQYLNQ